MTSIFYLGTPIQFKNESFFLPSTMWNDFVVNSVDCAQCQEWDNHTYDRLNSTTSNFTLENATMSLGATEVQGYIGTDRVCWKNRTDYCVEGVRLFEALEYNLDYIPPI